MHRRIIAALLACIGGTMLIIAGATGSTGIIGTIIEYMIQHLGGSTANLLELILHTLNFIADLGGAAVIIGGILILKQKTRIGKFTIGLGAGMGVTGFLITLVSSILHGWINTINFILIMSQSIAWIGIILSISAIIITK